MKRKEKVILLLLLIFLLACRLYHINTPPLEIEESWRQADTESMAWNFADYDLNPLHPNLNYDGPLPNIPALEIQVTTYIIALLYKLFGHHYFLARLVPVIFFLLSAVYLYLLARKYISIRGAGFTLLVYGTLPLVLYYSRAIMPEAAALMFWIGSIYYFDAWADEWQKAESEFLRKRVYKKLILSGVFFSLALMTKPPVIFGVFVILYFCFRYFGWRWLVMKELWAYAGATLGSTFVYYYYSTSIAEFKFSLGITRDIILKTALTSFYSPASWAFFSSNLPRALTIAGLVLSAAGVFALRKKQTMLGVWFLAMILEMMFLVAPIRASYYLIFFLVPCALLIGNLLDRIADWTLARLPLGKLVVFALAIWLMRESYDQLQRMYTINEVMRKQTQVVTQLTTKHDLLVVGSFDPCLLSLSGRRGWRYNLKMGDSIPKDPYQELIFYIDQGAKYFVPIQGKVYGDDEGRLIRYIDSNYRKIEIIEGYPIYVLRD